MTSEQEKFQGIEFPDDADDIGSVKVDDFIRELEAKEKDLHITADLSIEIAEADFDDQNIPDFLQAELAADRQPAPAEPPAVNALHEEIRSLKARISEADAERLAVMEKAQQRIRDFENLKNRTERERQETFSNQMCNLATEMLPVLDNLNRALDFASEIPEQKSDEFQHFFDGIVLVNQQLNEIFAGMGIVPIASVGERFDPHFHEAVATDDTTDFPQNTVTTELLRGYRIGNKVIRHSMVKVAAASQTPKAE
ncbi:MAG TPA: nucleotide exchange factor GrpE [Pyrinomonadaceae bacterium]|nr:nucleotide exchange factor GrpE [Pyrinomonadaceae bacterium]